MKPEAPGRGCKVDHCLDVYFRRMVFFKDMPAPLPHPCKPLRVGQEGSKVRLYVRDLMLGTHERHNIVRKLPVPAPRSYQARECMVPNPQLTAGSLPHGRMTQIHG